MIKTKQIEKQKSDNLEKDHFQETNKSFVSFTTPEDYDEFDRWVVIHVTKCFRSFKCKMRYLLEIIKVDYVKNEHL